VRPHFRDRIRILTRRYVRGCWGSSGQRGGAAGRDRLLARPGREPMQGYVRCSWKLT